MADALVLTCGHDLCLDCAAKTFSRTRPVSGRAIRCTLCSSVTELVDDTVSALTARGAATALQTAAALQSAATAASNAAFDRIDANHDGVISRDELSRAIASGPPALGATAGARGACGVCGSEWPPQVRGQAASAQPARWQLGEYSTTAAPTTASATREWRSPSSLQSSQQLWAPAPRWSLAVPRCPEHPEEPAMYFCATCECPCICAECVVQKDGRHRDHEVMRTGRAHEALRARAGSLIDQAGALQDDLAIVADRLAWRRKDVERAAARGRASVRAAFARVRAQLQDREAELMGSLDVYEGDSLARLDKGGVEHAGRLSELRRLQDSLRNHCNSEGDAVEALNTYAAAKAAIAELRETLSHEDVSGTAPAKPDDFVGLASGARAELDSHAEGLASLEEAVAALCQRGVEFPQPSPRTAGFLPAGAEPIAQGRPVR